MQCRKNVDQVSKSNLTKEEAEKTEDNHNDKVKEDEQQLKILCIEHKQRTKKTTRQKKKDSNTSHLENNVVK